MTDYSRIEDPCFVCEIEDELGEERGTNSHPINCGWKLKLEYEVMEKELEKDGKILIWSESENRPKIFINCTNLSTTKPFDGVGPHPTIAKQMKDMEEQK